MPRIASSAADRQLNRRDVAVAIGLFALAVALFANSLGHEFVWDDTAVIRDNPFLRERGAWWHCFGRDFGLEIIRRPVGYYRPVVFLSFLLNYAEGGLHPFAYHAANVWLHGLNTVLVFCLLGRLAGRRIGTLAAAFFAVHPVHAESVAFIAGRSDLLCACFLLLSLLATARSFEARRGARAAWQGAALFAYAAALLSKELAVALPGVLLAYGLIHRFRFRTILALCAPTAVVAALYLGFRFCVLPMALVDQSSLSLDSEFASRGARLLFYYAAQQVFPVIPTLGAKVLARRLWVDVAAVALLVLLLAVARPRRLATDAAAWLAMFLAPALWVSLFAGIELSDRFAYVPSVGICALAAIAVARYWERVRLVRVALAILLAAFALLSFYYGRMWRNPISLWRASIAYHPQSGRSYYNLGNAYWGAGMRTEAAPMLRKAVRLSADDESRFRACANLAQLLAESGEDALAIEYCRRGLKIRPDRTQLRRLLAELFSNRGQHDNAIDELQTTLRFAPKNPDVHLDLAREYLAIRPAQLDRARQHYQHALELGAPTDETIEAAIAAAEAGRSSDSP